MYGVWAETLPLLHVTQRRSVGGWVTDRTHTYLRPADVLLRCEASETVDAPWGALRGEERSSDVGGNGVGGTDVGAASEHGEQSAHELVGSDARFFVGMTKSQRMVTVTF